MRRRRPALRVGCLLGVPVVVGLWMSLVSVVGWMHARRCILDGFDAGISDSGRGLLPGCLGPAWNDPVRGLDWSWPPDVEVVLWTGGTAVAAATAVVLLVVAVLLDRTPFR